MNYVFVPANFRLIYPEFASLTDQQLFNYYYGSQQYYPGLIVGMDDNQAAYVINLIVAHLISMSPSSGQSNGSGGGRLLSASEGSVTATIAFNPSETGWFWNSSPYGQQVWQLMLSIGGARYAPGLPVRARCFYRRNRW